MINWNSFENVLVSQFKSFVSGGTDEEEVATFIGTQYNLFAKTGGDLNYQNPVIRGNTTLLILNLKIGFIRSRAQNDISYFIDGLKKGVESYWKGAQLGRITPPPSATSIISNTVLNAGTFPDVQFESAQSHEPFARRLSQAMRTHMLSVSGLTVANVPSPSGQTPQNFPWNGYN